MKVEVVRDWFDYLQAAITLASILLAGGAVWFAARSARDAAQSASAAQETASYSKETAEHSEKTAEHSAEMARHAGETAKLQREEHQAFLEAQSLRPEVVPQLEIVGLETQQDGTTKAEMKWGAVNTGSKNAENALMFILSSRSTKLQQTNIDGSHPRDVSLVPQSEQVNVDGAAVEAHSWNQDVNLRPNIRDIRSVAVIFPDAGEYEVKVCVRHPEIDSGYVSISETIRVPKVARPEQSVQ